MDKMKKKKKTQKSMIKTLLIQTYEQENED